MSKRNTNLFLNVFLSQISNTFRVFHVTDFRSCRNIEDKGIDLTVNRATSRDFGSGFYLTPDPICALEYADKVGRSSDEVRINEYYLDLSHDEPQIYFSQNKDYWDFVLTCRLCYNDIKEMNEAQKHSIVIGPTLNDRQIKILASYEVEKKYQILKADFDRLASILDSLTDENDMFCQVLIHEEKVLRNLHEVKTYSYDEFAKKYEQTIKLLNEGVHITYSNFLISHGFGLEAGIINGGED